MHTTAQSQEVRLRVVITGRCEDIRAFGSHISDSYASEVSVLPSERETLEALEREPIDLILVDLASLTSQPEEFVRQIRERSEQVQVLLLAPPARIADAVKAMRAGASDYLAHPCNPEEMTAKLERALERISLLNENRYLKEQVRLRNGYGRLLGSAPAMQKLFRAIIKVSASNCPVLIIGESGTGKELVARSIHENSAQRDKPFLPIDCAAIAPALFESELFGHVRGAFTGAVRDKEGLLAAAQGGVVFFDEVGELPAEVQAKLLRALQEHEIRPVGSNRTVPFSARVLAATNRDLQAAVQEGHFRADLFYRLNVVPLRIPPLRDRKDDIPLLAEHFLRRSAPPNGVRRMISQNALDSLIGYDWPGNIRELENSLQRAVALSSGPTIQIADLPTALQGRFRPAAGGQAGARSVVPLADMEREAILRAVEQCGGDKLQAAQMLGIGKTTLYRKLKEYGSR